MSSSVQSYRTQAMPCWMSAAAASRSCSVQQACAFSLDTACIEDPVLLDRRMSSYTCSTSGCSNKERQFGRSQFQQRLPLASVSAHQAGFGAAAASPNNSSKLASQQQNAPEAVNANDPLGQLKQMSPEQLKSAIDRVTAKDTFKAGDMLNNGRYKLNDKLGMSGEYGLAEGMPEGRFTTLWDATDLATGKQVVMKCVEGGDSTSYLAGSREASLHAQAGRHPGILQLLDAFEHRSSAGRHACMVLEKAGSNLDIVEQLYGGRYREQDGNKKSGLCLIATPLGRTALRSIARQTLEALDHLHTKKGIVHMDISSDNLLLDKPFQHIRELNERALIGQGWQRVANFGLAVAGALGSKQAMQSLQKQVDAATDDQRLYHEQNLHQATVKLTDFGRAVPYKQQQQQSGAAGQQPLLDHNRDGLIVMNDPALRPPEEILALDYVTPAYDIWRTGCVMFELATGMPLFTPAAYAAARQQNPELQRYSDDMMHLLDMQTVLGQMPREFIHKSPLYDEFFLRQSDQLRVTKSIGLRPRSESVGRLVLRLTQGSIGAQQAVGFQDFVSAMLVYDPARRPSAADMLKHEWLKQEESHGQQTVTEAGSEKQDSKSR